MFTIIPFFSNAQNVGIGIINPFEKLEVAGNIKATTFLYANPKTCYYTLSGIDLAAEKSTDTTLTGAGSGEKTLLTAVPGKRMIVPVHLPDGAIMVNMKVYVNDFSINDNLQIVFYSKTITSNFYPDNVGFINSAGSSGLVLYQTNLFSSPVDNAFYTYYITVGTENYGNPFPGNAYLRAIIIEYTMNATQ